MFNLDDKVIDKDGSVGIVTSTWANKESEGCVLLYGSISISYSGDTYKKLSLVGGDAKEEERDPIRAVYESHRQSLIHEFYAALKDGVKLIGEMNGNCHLSPIYGYRSRLLGLLKGMELLERKYHKDKVV